MKTHTICRACHLSCSMIVEMTGGKPVKIYGDKDNPISHGYSCIRGRELASYATLPSRLTRSMERQPDGAFRPLPHQDAARNISAKLNAIIAEHGPRSVAIFLGTWGYLNALTRPFINAFAEAVGTPMFFTAETIDQPGKAFVGAFHGRWLGGALRAYEPYDAMVLFGVNPLVSGGGPFNLSPAYNLHQAKKHGTKLVVFDPRRTETAEHADIYCQLRPAEDATVMAGLIRIIIDEGLYDREFVAAETNGLEALRKAVEPFTPEWVAARADISVDDLVAVARLYAGARRGLVAVGTGPNMSGRSTLTEYLCAVLTTVCGNWPRAGERLTNPGVLFNMGTPIAAALGPMPAMDPQHKLRVHDLSKTVIGFQTSLLPDEILLPGEGRVRALLVLGGNPMIAFPDQEKTLAAMKALDLLVCFDPHMSGTARLADYVIAPPVALETAGVSAVLEQFVAFGSPFGFDVPYQQYTPALMPPPPGADVVEEWQFVYKLAQEMGLQLTVKSMATFLCGPEETAATSTKLDMSKDMTTDEALACAYRGSPVSLDEVKEKARAGHIFDVSEKRIGPKPEGWQGRLDIGNVVMMAELGALEQNKDVGAVRTTRPYRLLARRMKDVFNSSWLEHEPLKRKWRYNPAFICPADMDALRLKAGDTIRIRSDKSSILAIAEPDQSLKAGCISMSHGWGANPDELEDPLKLGGTTSRLCNNETNCDPYSWIPIMSAIPVSIERATPPEEGGLKVDDCNGASSLV